MDMMYVDVVTFACDVGGHCRVSVDTLHSHHLSIIATGVSERSPSANVMFDVQHCTTIHIDGLTDTSSVRPTTDAAFTGIWRMAMIDVAELRSFVCDACEYELHSADMTDSL